MNAFPFGSSLEPSNTPSQGTHCITEMLLRFSFSYKGISGTDSRVTFFTTSEYLVKALTLGRHPRFATSPYNLNEDQLKLSPRAASDELSAPGRARVGHNATHYLKYANGYNVYSAIHNTIYPGASLQHIYKFTLRGPAPQAVQAPAPRQAAPAPAPLQATQAPAPVQAAPAPQQAAPTPSPLQAAPLQAAQAPAPLQAAQPPAPLQAAPAPQPAQAQMGHLYDLQDQFNNLAGLLGELRPLAQALKAQLLTLQADQLITFVLKGLSSVSNSNLVRLVGGPMVSQGLHITLQQLNTLATDLAGLQPHARALLHHIPTVQPPPDMAPTVQALIPLLRQIRVVRRHIGSLLGV